MLFRHVERHLALHLTVLTVLAGLVVAALIVEGGGLALIVAIAGGVLLAAGVPLGAIVAEQRSLPSQRGRT